MLLRCDSSAMAEMQHGSRTSSSRVTERKAERQPRITMMPEIQDQPPQTSDPAVRSSDLLGRMVEQPVARVNEAIARYRPKLVIALFSGGHDSLSAVKVASLSSRFDGCLHVNTGIGIEATREFVRVTCADNYWR